MFSVKGQVVNILGFAGHKGLCGKDSTLLCSSKAAGNNM